jgi:hypothetical protein
MKAYELQIPVFNNHSGFGCLAFLEIVVPWDTKDTIRKHLKGIKVDGVGLLLQKE